ncbi:MAG: hypothetical protein Q8R55_07110 [Candidatus Taylorbacteria bacterium]|nr:hypothetical protein [Candidatus Taylorbacteria bacterium]
MSEARNKPKTTNVKRYVVFAGQEYESTSGGWDDRVCDREGNNSFDTIEEARALAIENQEWSHVVDLHMGEKIFEWRKYSGKGKPQIKEAQPN